MDNEGRKWRVEWQAVPPLSTCVGSELRGSVGEEALSLWAAVEGWWWWRRKRGLVYKEEHHVSEQTRKNKVS